MCVIVPVTERSMSPSISETPTAPPGSRAGSGSVILAEPAVPMSGAKPSPEKTPPPHSPPRPGGGQRTRAPGGAARSHERREAEPREDAARPLERRGIEAGED